MSSLGLAVGLTLGSVPSYLVPFIHDRVSVKRELDTEAHPTGWGISTLFFMLECVLAFNLSSSLPGQPCGKK